LQQPDDIRNATTNTGYKTVVHMQPSRPFLRTSHNNNLSRQQSSHDNNPRVSYFHSLSQYLQQHRACFCLSLAYEQAKRLTKGSLASAISDQFHRSTNSDPELLGDR
jgi:hypothetical protein